MKNIAVNEKLEVFKKWAATTMEEDDTQEEELPVERSRFDNLVVREAAPWRKWWNVVVFWLLVYSGTALPYQVAFIDFHIPHVMEESAYMVAFEWAIDSLFWFDLVVSFFFSYEDKRGNEITSIKKVVRNYVRGYFTVNLLACAPERLVEELISAVGTEVTVQGDNAGKAGKLLRMNRISRLSRLIRLVRLAKLAKMVENSRLWKKAMNNRWVRIINFTIGLMWVVHLLACFWYLIAALHDNYEDTWVARRQDGAGQSIVDSGPFVQWCHSMYFVFTVFTTVGFGDISAFTLGEIIAAITIMILGTVVNGIIVSEIINVLTSIDETAEEDAKRKHVVHEFSKLTHMDSETKEQLARWVQGMRGERRSALALRADMSNLLFSGRMPRRLLEKLPEQMYMGELSRNSGIIIGARCLNRASFPRFVLTMVLSLTECHHAQGSLIYEINDHPIYMFLVLGGTYALVARRGDAPSQDNPEPKALNQKGTNPSDVTAGAGFALSIVTGTNESTKKTNLIDQEREEQALCSPYQLFSARSYVGDVEVLMNMPRRSTLRCESLHGLTLAMHKNQRKNIDQEFPQAIPPWVQNARRRENQRQKLFNQHKNPMTYKHLAAFILQSRLRDLVKRARQEVASGRRAPRVAPNTGGLSLLSLVEEPECAGAGKTDSAEPLRQEMNTMKADIRELKEIAKMNFNLLRELARDRHVLRVDI